MSTDVSFVAAGQLHTNHQWIEAMHPKLLELQATLARTGGELVLAVERGPCGENPSNLITSMRHTGAVTAYFDQLGAGEEPDFEAFKQETEGRLDLSGKRLLPGLQEETEDQVARRIFDQEAAALQEGNRGMRAGQGAAYLAQAALLEAAHQQGIRIIGIDAMTDAEKRKRLSDPPTAAELGAVEFRRVDGMAEAVTREMERLAQGQGGIIVGVNIGQAHLASLTLGVQDKAAQSAVLTSPDVHLQVRRVAVLQPGPAYKEQETAKQRMRLSPDEIDAWLASTTAEALDDALQTAQSELTKAQALRSAILELPKDSHGQEIKIRSDLMAAKRPVPGTAAERAVAWTDLKLRELNDVDDADEPIMSEEVAEGIANLVVDGKLSRDGLATVLGCRHLDPYKNAVAKAEMNKSDFTQAQGRGAAALSEKVRTFLLTPNDISFAGPGQNPAKPGYGAAVDKALWPTTKLELQREMVNRERRRAEAPQVQLSPRSGLNRSR